MREREIEQCYNGIQYPAPSHLSEYIATSKPETVVT